MKKRIFAAALLAVVLASLIQLVSITTNVKAAITTPLRLFQTESTATQTGLTISTGGTIVAASPLSVSANDHVYIQAYFANGTKGGVAGNDEFDISAIAATGQCLFTSNNTGVGIVQADAAAAVVQVLVSATCRATQDDTITPRATAIVLTGSDITNAQIKVVAYVLNR